MFRPADVDDTAGFMAAVRARNQNSQAITSATIHDASSNQETHPKPSTFFVGNPTAPETFFSSPSSFAGNYCSSQGDASPTLKVSGKKKNFSPIGSPTSPEFVPSSSSSLAGNSAGSQNGFSPASPKIPSIVSNPAAEEFVHSKPSSFVGNPIVEDNFSVFVPKEQITTSRSVFLAPRWTRADGNVFKPTMAPRRKVDLTASVLSLSLLSL